MKTVVTVPPKGLEEWLRLVRVDDGDKVIDVRYVHRMLIIADDSGLCLPGIPPCNDAPILSPVA